MPSDDEWRDYESVPSMAPFPDADGRGMWVEATVRCKLDGDGTVKAFHLTGQTSPVVKVVATGDATVRGGYILLPSK